MKRAWMNPEFYSLIEMVLSLGVVLALGIWQLASLRRCKEQHDASESQDGGPPR
jgi:hypothetical protein